MSRFIHRWTARLALGLVLALSIVPAAAAHPALQATDPTALADAYLAGNPDAQAPLLADDAVLRIVPAPLGTTGVWSGKEQVASYLDFSRSQEPRTERVGSWQVSGDHVSGTVMVTVNDFRKVGLGAVKHQYDFVIQGGKIKSVTATVDASELPRVQAAFEAYAAAHPVAAPPGMPTTGAPQALLPLLIAMGMLLLTLGAALHRRKA
jgi:hypothetical protein